MQAGPHLAAALAALAGRVDPARVDRLWLFPPRVTGEKESGLAVLSLFDEEEPAARREVWTLSYEAETPRAGKPRRTDELVPQGTVPRERVAGIIDGVVRRSGGEGDPPEPHELDGDPERWRDLLSDLGVPLDGAFQ